MPRISEERVTYVCNGMPNVSNAAIAEDSSERDGMGLRKCCVSLLYMASSERFNAVLEYGE